MKRLKGEPAGGEGTFDEEAKERVVRVSYAAVHNSTRRLQQDETHAIRRRRQSGTETLIDQSRLCPSFGSFDQILPSISSNDHEIRFVLSAGRLLLLLMV